MSAPGQRRPWWALGGLAAVTLTSAGLMLTHLIRDWAATVLFATVATSAILTLVVIATTQADRRAWPSDPMLVAAAAISVVTIATVLWALAAQSPWPLVLSGSAALGLTLSSRPRPP